MELVPRVSRRLYPEYPSDALSAEACVFQAFKNHDGSDRHHVSRLRRDIEHGGGNVFGSETRSWLMRDDVKYDGRTQKTKTVPPTSHRRPVFFNQTHRQFINDRGATRSLDNCHRPETRRGRSSAAPQIIK